MTPGPFTAWPERAGARWQRGQAAAQMEPRTFARFVLEPMLIGALLGLVAGDGLGWPTGAGPGLGALVGASLGAWRASAAAAPRFSRPGWRHLVPRQHGRLRLRHMERRDATVVVATIDEEVVRWNGWTDDIARHASVVLSYPLLAIEQGHLVVCGSDDQPIGMVVFRDIEEDEPDAASLGCWLGPNGRGKGLGAEMIAAAGQVAWTLGLRSLTLGTSVANVAMRRTFEKAGALHEEDRPHALPNGDVVASTWYRLHRPLGWSP